VGFATLVNANLKKNRGYWRRGIGSTKLANGMGGVMNEGGLEGWKMQKHVQTNVEDCALA